MPEMPIRDTPLQLLIMITHDGQAPQQTDAFLLLRSGPHFAIYSTPTAGIDVLVEGWNDHG